MARISWSDRESGRYSSGLDRGVLFPGGDDSVAWIGLTNVSERHEGSEPEPVYVNGVKVLDVPHKPEFAATMTAFTYPEEFERYQGRDSIYDGFSVGEQVVDEVFHLSYRTMIDGGPDYLLHILFNLTAVANDVERTTFSDEQEPLEFAWELSSTPYVEVNGKLPPFSHLIIDSRYSGSILTVLEDRIYGDSDNNGSISNVTDILDKIVDINVNEEWYYLKQEDGAWTLIGPDSKHSIDGDTWTGVFDKASVEGKEYTITDLKEF